MKALPQASATGNIHIGTMQGKLNGVMPATTPSGWRSEWLSTLVPTFSVTSPFSRCGMPTANSTTSRPRVTSPRASSWVLPCSAEISSAILSAFSISRNLNLSRMRARRSGGVFAQAGQATLATATNSPTSAARNEALHVCTSGFGRLDQRGESSRRRPGRPVVEGVDLAQPDEAQAAFARHLARVVRRNPVDGERTAEVVAAFDADTAQVGGAGFKKAAKSSRDTVFWFRAKSTEVSFRC